MKRNHVRGMVVLTVATVVGLAILSCSNDANPYVPGKAGVSLLSSRFADGDTVAIFSTDTFKIEFQLQTHIDSFMFHADSNRYWRSADTVVRKSTFASSSWPWSFGFPVSFFDTGWTTVRVTAWRSDRTVLTDSIRLLRVNPLHQEDIVAEPGEVVTLSTAPVSDPFVIYVWKVGIDSSTISDQPTASKVLSSAIASGELYVKSYGVRSPGSRFQVVPADRTGPTIICLADSLSTDSLDVVTGIVPFPLTVEVIDASPLSSVRFNGILSDTCALLSAGRWVCTRLLTALSPSAPLAVEIEALDSKGNRTLRTFRVHYDSTLVVEPVIVVESPEDSARVPGRLLSVGGRVDNLYGADSVYLLLSLNSIAQSPERLLTPSSNKWGWDVTLGNDANELALLLERREGSVRDTVDQVWLTVVLDTAVQDQNPPEIQAISVGATAIVDTFVSTTSLVTVSVRAFDPSGIAGVTVGGQTAQLDPTGAYRAAVALAHTRLGNRVALSVRDNFDNVAHDTITLFVNRKPTIDSLPAFTYLTAGTEYTDTIAVSDPDIGDTLKVTVLISAPSGSYVRESDARGIFSWTPIAADTAGPTAISVQVSDGYPGVVEGQYQVSVRGGATTVKAKFLTATGEFPDTLYTGRDSLHIALRIDQALSPNHLFSARIVQTGVYLLLNASDTVLRWVPSLADTGTRTLVVTVSSGPGLIDTIVPLPVIRVLEAFVPPSVGFALGASTTVESVGMHPLSVRISRPLTTPVTVHYRVQWTSGTSVDSSDFSLPTVRRLEFLAGDTARDIPLTIVDDSLVETTEKITLVLEMPLPADSLTLGTKVTHLCYIADNDTAAQVDTVFFSSLDASTRETATSVGVGIRVKSPASKQLRVTIATQGSATHGSDYTVAPTDITIAKGDTAAQTVITIVDDNICEQTNETVTLRLQARTPAMFVTDSIYNLTILPSDTQLCVKPVALVYGGNTPSALEASIAKMIDSMNYPVEQIYEQSLSTATLSRYSMIMLSSTLRGTTAGALLKEAKVPVLCASLPNAVTLDLTGSSDTITASATTLKVYSSGMGTGGMVRITDNLVLVPATMRPKVYGATRIAEVDVGGGGPILMKQVAAPIPLPVEGDTLLAIYYHNDVSSRGAYPTRRCTFPVCKGTDIASPPSYTVGWWGLLRMAVTLTITGSFQ